MRAVLTNYNYIIEVTFNSLGVFCSTSSHKMEIIQACKIYLQFSTWIKINIALFKTTRCLSKLLASVLKFLNIHKALEKPILNEVFQIFNRVSFAKNFSRNMMAYFLSSASKGKHWKLDYPRTVRGFFALRRGSNFEVAWPVEPLRGTV